MIVEKYDLRALTYIRLQEVVDLFAIKKRPFLAHHWKIMMVSSKPSEYSELQLLFYFFFLNYSDIAIVILKF